MEGPHHTTDLGLETFQEKLLWLGTTVGVNKWVLIPWYWTPGTLFILPSLSPKLVLISTMHLAYCFLSKYPMIKKKICHSCIRHSFVCTGWESNRPRESSSSECTGVLWAEQELFPPWLTQADGMLQLWDCEVSLVMSGLCSALASFSTKHWNRGGAAVLRVTLWRFSWQVGLCPLPVDLRSHGQLTGE